MAHMRRGPRKVGAQITIMCCPSSRVFEGCTFSDLGVGPRYI